MNTHKTTAAVSGGPVVSRCVSCGKVLGGPSGSETQVRESAATIAMSATQECSACRMADYRRSLKDLYTR